MNLVLFAPGDLGHPLADHDPRVRHVCETLRRKVGDSFDCGLVNGPRGRARIASLDESGMHLDITWGEAPPPLPPILLLVGLPRPQTARKILGEATAFGISEIHFHGTERGEPSYGASTLWTSGEVERLLMTAAAQAFCTRLPNVARHVDLPAALTHLGSATTRLALDNYESTLALDRAEVTGTPAVLAVGSERGWSQMERTVLRDAAFTLVDLGPRVLRTETACIVGLALLKSRLGLH